MAYTATSRLGPAATLTFCGVLPLYLPWREGAVVEQALMSDTKASDSSPRLNPLKRADV